MASITDLTRGTQAMSESRLPTAEEMVLITAEMTQPRWRIPEAKLASATALILGGEIGHHHTRADAYLAQPMPPDTEPYVATKSGCTCKEAKKQSHCAHVTAVEILSRWEGDAYVSRVATGETVSKSVENGTASKTAQDAPNFAPASQQATDKEKVGSMEPAPQQSPSPTIPSLPLSLPRLPLRSIQAIVSDLSRPLPPACIATRKAPGNLTVRYLHWQHVARILDAYAPGWSGQVTNLTIVTDRDKDMLTGDKVVVTYRLTIPAAEGDISREATGQEDVAMVEEYVVGEVGKEEVKTRRAYGDSSSNAEAMAFKRAAAKFGVGSDLYDREGDVTSKALEKHLMAEKTDLLKRLATHMEAAGWSKEVVMAHMLAQAGCRRRGDVAVGTLAAFEDALTS